MPLNTQKNYAYVPLPVGPTKLLTRSSRRSRLYAGGTYFRSVRRGQDANLLKLAVVEDLSLTPDQGVFVVQDLVFKPSEQIFSGTLPTSNIELFNLTLGWNQEIRIVFESGALRAKLYGIRWQIGGAPDTLIEELGEITVGKLFTARNRVSFKVVVPWTVGTMVIRPRTKVYRLQQISVPTEDGLDTVTGWNIGALRTLVNADVTSWVTLPIRAGIMPGAEPPGADVQDTGDDALVMFDFAPTFMAGGDGLPASPAGHNTGPDRTLLHLNYSEVSDGSLGVLNEIYEWAGDSSSIGSWQRYS